MVVNKGFNLAQSIYFLILIIILYMIVTAWDALLDNLFYHITGLSRNCIIFHLASAAFFTLIGFLILYIYNEPLISIFGIDPIMG